MDCPKEDLPLNFERPNCPNRSSEYCDRFKVVSIMILADTGSVTEREPAIYYVDAI
jgi:hypothetical protein